jgi:hypothetical protein
MDDYRLSFIHTDVLPEAGDLIIVPHVDLYAIVIGTPESHSYFCRCMSSRKEKYRSVSSVNLYFINMNKYRTLTWCTAPSCDESGIYPVFITIRTEI